MVMKASMRSRQLMVIREYTRISELFRKISPRKEMRR